MRNQHHSKYSRPEFERRFLVRELPAELQDCREYRRITDRYIPGTRLRLRRMESSAGNHLVLKLTQKCADTSPATSHTTITTIYLNEEEYRCLEALGGNELTKYRYVYHYGGRGFGIDVFRGRHEGLILAEVEGEAEEELRQVAVPPFIVREVTAEPFFTGGALAGVATAEFRRTLTEYLAG